MDVRESRPKPPHGLPGGLSGRRRRALGSGLLVAAWWAVLSGGALLVAAQAPGGSLRQLVENGDYEALRAQGPQILDELVALYEESNEDQRARIAGVFYRLGWKSEHAKDVLMKDVKTGHEDLRINVQYALGRVSNAPEVVDVLFENMRYGETWLFRDKAACSLAYDQIHLTEEQRLRLFQLVIASLDDADRGQRHLAIQILEVETGQRKGYDPMAPRDARLEHIRQWYEWWHDYRISVAELGEL